MKIVSVNVAQPREVVYEGKPVRSSIWKEPVHGPVEVGETNLSGDRQAAAVVHGGMHKAVYAFSHDHYGWWKTELQRTDLPAGMFGENLTISGLDEAQVRIGDQWQVGSARFAVTGPRIPCSNLAMKFNDKSVPKRFSEAGWPGVYLRVLQTGSVSAGDSVKQIASGEGATIHELFHAYTHPGEPTAQEILQRALTNPFLDPELAGGINKRLKAAQAARAKEHQGTDQPYETLDPENWEEMRTLAHRMIDDAVDYLRDVADRPVWQPVPDEVRQRLQAPAPQQPEGPGQAYAEFKRDILPYPMGNIHPRFWAWYMGSGTFMGAMGDFMAAIMNPNLGGANHVAPLVEHQVIGWLRDMVGFPAGASGLLTSGGSAANLIGLTVARNTNCGYDVRHEGVRAAPGPLTAYASTEVHSCNKKAVETLGLGSHGLRAIAVNADYTIDLQALQRQIDADRADGMVPFCVIGNAGTINTGAIDDLHALAELCQREKLWFHVDGAIGAVAVLADNVRRQLAGMERADSLALDLHKWMHVPFEAGCVLVRSESAHREAFSLTPEYLAIQHESKGLASGSFWFSDYGLQLTRQFRALKVWLSIKEHGLERFGRMIARNVEQAHYLGGLIEKQPQLELTAPIGLDIVCFRFNPGGLDQERLEQLNRDILGELQEQGIAAPSYTTLHGTYCLRVAIANHRSRRSDFDLLVEAVLDIGRELMEK